MTKPATTEQTAAQRLGAAIAAARTAAKVPYRELEGRCWTKERKFKQWESGEDVPNSAQWGALKGRIRDLNAYDNLWREARYEADREECEEDAAPVTPLPVRIADAPSAATNAADAPPSETSSVDAAIRAAVELLRDAVPSLASFALSVNEDGGTEVRYELRRVVVEKVPGAMTLPAPRRA